MIGAIVNQAKQGLKPCPHDSEGILRDVRDFRFKYSSIAAKPIGHPT